MKFYQKKIRIFLFSIFIILLFFAAGNYVLASSDTLLFGGQQAEVGQSIGLGETDPRIVIANVIRIVLGFLGIIAVILIMYAGWLYMTAAGDEQKISKAKNILLESVIGLAIILASFAITTFVLNRLYDATGANAPVNGTNCPSYMCEDADGNCYPCNVPPNSTILTSSFVPPNGSSDYPMNTIGRVAFSQSVDQNSGTFDNGGHNLQYNFENNRRISFTNNETCEQVAAGTNISVPNSWRDRPCFDPDVQYTVSVNGYQALSSGQDLTCGTDGSLCQSSFRVSGVFDTIPPTVSIRQNQAMCQGDEVRVFANAIDNFGISELTFSVTDNNGQTIFFSTSTPASATRTFSDSINITSVIASPGNYNVNVIALDIAGNTNSANRIVNIWPNHCCNNVLDGAGSPNLLDPNEPETGIDCGGECGACEGGACAIDINRACSDDPDNCSTNLCSDTLLCNCENNNGTNCTQAGYLDLNGNPYDINSFARCCICRLWPLIENITPAGGGICVDTNGHASSPMIPCLSNGDCSANYVCDLTFLDNIPNGSPGTMVTISGRNFGNNPGSVFFCRSNVAGVCSDWQAASLAQAINPACSQSWSDEQIIAVVPNNAVEGPIRVQTASGYSEATDDNWGNLINDFWVNNFQRPGICQIENPQPSGSACLLDADCSPYRCLNIAGSNTCSRAQGYFEETLNYHGLNMPNGSRAYFGDFNRSYSEAVANTSLFNGQAGSADIPNIASGRTTTFLINNNLLSNYLNFYKVGEPGTGPKIIYFNPTIGTRDTYITIHGQGFGYAPPQQIGVNYQVFFDTDLSNNNINDPLTLGVPGNFDFPQVCRTEGLWRDTSILVKAPALQDNTSYYIVLRADVWNNLVDSGEVDEAINGYRRQFNYQNNYPLIPGLCAIRPWSGQRNDLFSLYGEGFGLPATHLINFGNLVINNFSYTTENDADKLDSSVPNEAINGNNAVSVSRLSGNACVSDSDCAAGWSCYQNRCQAIGNSLNFKVGECANDYECFSGSFCCLSGPSQGRCESGTNREEACSRTFGSGVYSFDISTGSSTNPDIPEYESCMGYGARECGYNYCPNSPGWCSYNTSTSNQTANNCDDNYCDSQIASSTVYNLVINRCTNGNACDLESTASTTINNQAYQMRKYCGMYQNQALFHYRLNGGSCEIPENIFHDGINNWVNIGNNVCVHQNENCSICADSFSCFDAGSGNNQGICAINRRVCGNGFACQSGVCANTIEPCCECCCDINRNTGSGNPGCCAPLLCGGDCGNGGIDNNNNGNYSDSGEADFGVCMGCTVTNTDGSINIDASDNACNCTNNNISGKYCDTNALDGRGVCRDCASLSDQTSECSLHGTCCVDFKNNNNCRGTVGQNIYENSLNYCGYYDCEIIDGLSVCSNTATRDGTYRSTDCDQQCENEGGSRLGAECKIIVNNDFECSYDICPDLFCLDTNGNELGYDNQGNLICSDGTCGNCCCDPERTGSDPNDQATYDLCKSLNPSFPNLACKPNQNPCTGSERGLCCGCTQDIDCNSNPLNIGCGDDGCCRSRPRITSYLPEANTVGVCRNVLIQAEFDQRMDDTTLAGNVYVVGNYVADTCPANSTYLTLKSGQFVKDNFWIKIYKKALYALNEIIRPILGRNAFAADNFCAIEGVTTSLYNSLSGRTTLNFAPRNLLAPNINYYVIIKGDRNLDSQSGVLNYYGIGMVENNINNETDVTTFNGLDFTNSKIWRFTTGSALCNFSYVDIVPDNYVFKLEENEETVIGKRQVFQALARANNGTIISPTIEYNWDWNWSINNPMIINFSGGSPAIDLETGQSAYQDIEAQNQVDAATYLNAVATIVVVPPELSAELNTTKSGQELVRVFACKNPWPLIINGQWIPWIDQFNNCVYGNCLNTNYEIYYCRDAKGPGTSDDLPAISNNATTIGMSLECSDGSGNCQGLNEGNACSDGSGACEYEVLKESYFFRENLPGAVNLVSADLVPRGEEVELRWNFTLEPGNTLSSFKIYYGEQPGRYTRTLSVSSAENSHIVSGLTNGREYYFAVTAIYDTGAESSYSNEISATPIDSERPIPPDINQISVSTSSPDIIRVQWDSSGYQDIGEILNFRVSYGVDTSCNGQSLVANNVNGRYSAVIENLNPELLYCLSFQVVDLSGNISDAVTENIAF